MKKNIPTYRLMIFTSRKERPFQEHYEGQEKLLDALEDWMEDEEFQSAVIFLYSDTSMRKLWNPRRKKIKG